MKKLNFFLLLILLPFLAVSQESVARVQQVSHAMDIHPNAGLHFNPPATAREPVTNTYFGMKVVDNYRWLENLKDPKVLSWLKAQANYTNDWLDKISGRDSLVASFTRLDALAPAEISNVQRKAGRYFFLKTLPHQNTAKLYYRQGEEGKDILLFDPRANGSQDNITAYLPSEDGRKVAFVVSKEGGEVGKIYTLNVDTKKLYPYKIGPTWDGVFSWLKDSKGFIYELLNGYDTKSMSALMNSKTMYHKLNNDPSRDKVVFSKKKYPKLDIDSGDICVVQYSEDYKYILAVPSNVSHDVRSFYASSSELLHPHIDWKPLTSLKDEITNIIVVGDNIYFLTHRHAPRYEVAKTSLEYPDFTHAKVVIPEGENTITNIARSKDYLFLTYSDGIDYTAKQYNLHTGELTPVKLPFAGSEGAFEVAPSVLTPYDITSNDGLIQLTSWNRPLTRYDYNADTKITKRSAFGTEVDYPGVHDLKVVETEARSYDGTMVPLSIVYNKNTKLDGTANCLLRGYGSYGISIAPFFSTMNLALLNRGVVFALAHVRGGGEKGEAWYKGGYKTTKPNTWKDFIACAEYLIQHRYTSSQKLIGMGTSAGGITIGRAITTRPDLFGAAIDNVGCTNMLRSETTTTGPANVAEFGTVKDSVESRALYEMDALHHVKKGEKYPAVICVGGMHDPRVMLWQPAKFAAKLQWATASDKPVLLDVNFDDGHFTQDKSVTFKNFANMFSFALWQTGNPQFQLKK